MVDAKFVPAVAMGCGFCGVDRKTRSQEELEGLNRSDRGLLGRSEQAEYTCYVCGGRLLCRVGHVIVARTGEAAWFSEPQAVDAYEYHKHGLDALREDRG